MDQTLISLLNCLLKVELQIDLENLFTNNSKLASLAISRSKTMNLIVMKQIMISSP